MVASKILNRIEKATSILCILAFSTMVVFAVGGVFFRYVLESSALSFSDELCRYSFIWAVFLAAPLCSRHNSHAAVDLLVNMVPKKVKNGLLTISTLAVISFLVLMVVEGIRITIQSINTLSASMEIPMWYIYVSIPISGLLMLIFTIERIYLDLKGASAPPDDGSLYNTAE
ncbi:MAG: hypothetical protein APF84_07760 [Gracilibacter sp. BRH_c7a]|nr:MAG: hypothetical protein APF84_07760 [Gracilibacter sp. BRH_c7a]